MHKIDLVEDIAIAYGYENFRMEIPHVATVGQEDAFEKFKRLVARFLTGLGMLEVNTFQIINRDYQTTKMDFDAKLISLADTKSKEHDTLRYWLIPSLMDVLARNKHHEYPQRIFTIGTVFKEDDREETIIHRLEVYHQQTRPLIHYYQTWAQSGGVDAPSFF